MLFVKCFSFLENSHSASKYPKQMVEKYQMQMISLDWIGLFITVETDTFLNSHSFARIQDLSLCQCMAYCCPYIERSFKKKSGKSDVIVGQISLIRTEYILKQAQPYKTNNFKASNPLCLLNLKWNAHQRKYLYVYVWFSWQKREHLCVCVCRYMCIYCELQDR